MQRLEVSGAVRPIYGSLGGKRLISTENNMQCLGTKQKYTVLPGIPPPPNGWGIPIKTVVQSTQTHLCVKLRTPLIFKIQILQFNDLYMICRQ